MKEKELERIAEESLSSGENNLAIVLYAYLGASKAGMGGVYAKHCQNFARKTLKGIEGMDNEDNGFNVRNN